MHHDDVYCIGRIGKAHGIHGEVTFNFDDDIFDRVDADYIVIEVEGLLVPFFIEEYRFRSDNVALMKLEGVDSQERARELTNCEVFFPRSLAAEDEDDSILTYAFLVGFTIIDAQTGQRVGTIDSIDDSTANILFCFGDGTLVPAAEELIESIDKDKREIVLQIPEGLLDL